MTYDQINTLYQCLGSLSAPVTILVGGKPVEVRCRFKATTVLRIAEMRNLLSPHVKVAEEARNTIIASYGGEIKAGSPDFIKVSKELVEIASKPVEITGFGGLPKDEFLSDDNPVQPAALEHLLPYLN